MHPRTREVLEHLDARHAELDQAVAMVPASLRRRRPQADRWSVAEVLEHLAIVERRIAKMIGDQIVAARTAGLGPERDASPVGPTLDVAGLLNRSHRITASEAVQPPGELDADAAWAALNSARAATRALVEEADGLALGEVVIAHHRLGPLNVYQWLLFLGGHEGRHAAQIQEIAASTRTT